MFIFAGMPSDSCWLRVNGVSWISRQDKDGLSAEHWSEVRTLFSPFVFNNNSATSHASTSSKVLMRIHDVYIFFSFHYYKTSLFIIWSLTDVNLFKKVLIQDVLWFKYIVKVLISTNSCRSTIVWSNHCQCMIIASGVARTFPVGGGGAFDFRRGALKYWADPPPPPPKKSSSFSGGTRWRAPKKKEVITFVGGGGGPGRNNHLQRHQNSKISIF